ncbi:MAG: hypothetical protein NDI77_17990 [Geobacteraceae bacterium]|nr:hypothetical protein [Geobacteraceae bacterium]
MEKTLTPQEIRVLDICRQVELANEQLYLFFAELFKDDARLAQLWRKTAMEERNHANQFKLATAIQTGMIETVNLDFAEAAETLEFVRLLLDSAKKSPPLPEEALRIAVELEGKLSNFHMDCQVHFTEESFVEMFRAMMAADDEHTRAIRQAWEDFSRPA